MVRVGTSSGRWLHRLVRRGPVARLVGRLRFRTADRALSTWRPLCGILLAARKWAWLFAQKPAAGRITARYRRRMWISHIVCGTGRRSAIRCSSILVLLMLVSIIRKNCFARRIRVQLGWRLLRPWRFATRSHAGLMVRCGQRVSHMWPVLVKHTKSFAVRMMASRGN